MTAPLELEAALYRRAGKLRGHEIVFLCPEHDDHDPSARYNRSKEVWHEANAAPNCRRCRGLVA